MILLVVSFIFIINLIIFKKSKYEYLYIPVLIQSITLFILSFFSELDVLNISWIINSSWTLIIGSLISFISAVIIFREKEQSEIWYYQSGTLLLLMVNNKYVLAITVCVCLLVEVTKRIKMAGEPINSKFIYLIPTIMLITSFSDNLGSFDIYVFMLIGLLILLIDFFKLSVFRVFSLLIYANLIYQLELNLNFIFIILALGFVYLISEIYRSIESDNLSYKKIDLVERIFNKYIIARNSKEKVLRLVINQHSEKTVTNSEVKVINYENDIRKNFLMILGAFCTITLYLLVRG